MKRVQVLYFLVFNCVVGVMAQVDISKNADKALFQVLNNKPISGQTLINQERQKNPSEQILYLDYLENWKEVVSLFTNGTNEKYDAYLENLDRRLDKIHEKANKEAPEYNILLGEIYAHSGMANIMYGDYFSGFQKIVKANKHAKLNNKLYPDYWMNNKLCGILNVSFDKIPNVLRWLTNMFGLRGDSKVGYKQLDQYLLDVKDYPGLKAEGAFYYVFGLKLAKEEKRANEFLKTEIAKGMSPVLLSYLHANFLYMNNENEEAYKLISTYTKEEQEIPFVFLDFLKGKLKLNRLDDDAHIYLDDYLNNSQFMHFKREACSKLSLHYYAHGNLDKFYYYRNLINTYPKAATDRDLEADVEKNKSYLPHKQLLRTKLLCNGGYYNRAEDELSAVNPNKLELKEYQTEYFLLMGKIKSGQNKPHEALMYFKKTMQMGADEAEPYAAEAALLAGIEESKRGNMSLSHYYWNEALSIKGSQDVYVNNIHKKAKNYLEKNKI